MGGYIGYIGSIASGMVVVPEPEYGPIVSGAIGDFFLSSGAITSGPVNPVRSLPTIPDIYKERLQKAGYTVKRVDYSYANKIRLELLSPKGWSITVDGKNLDEIVTEVLGTPKQSGNMLEDKKRLITLGD